MERSTWFGTLLAAAAVLTGCGDPALLSPEGELAASRSAASCTNIEGNDIAQFTGPTSAEGTLSGDLEGEFEATIESITPGDDGSLHLVATRTIVNENGTITTSDSGVLSPREGSLFRANGQYTFVSGTGLYQDVSGGIRIHGDVDLGSGAVSLRYHGRICL